MKKVLLVCCLYAIFTTSYAQNTKENMSNPKAPIAPIKPKQLEKHGDVRIDNYNTVTADTKSFQTALFEEMKGRIKEDDESVPYLFNGYYYITRFEKGQDYPIYSRKKGSLDAAEEIMFNCNDFV